MISIKALTVIASQQDEMPISSESVQRHQWIRRLPHASLDGHAVDKETSNPWSKWAAEIQIIISDHYFSALNRVIWKAMS